VPLGDLGTLDGGYGYQTWIDDRSGAFVLWGYAGQFVWGVPAADLVIVSDAHYQGIGYAAAGQQAFAIASRLIRPLIAAAR
jgi:CubicO group peptidase (beta-lactamase class C family)